MHVIHSNSHHKTLSYRRDSLSNQTIHLATVGRKNPCLIRRDLLQGIKKRDIKAPRTANRIKPYRKLQDWMRSDNFIT